MTFPSADKLKLIFDPSFNRTPVAPLYKKEIKKKKRNKEDVDVDVWEGGGKKKSFTNNVRRFNSEDLQLEKRRKENRRE